MTHNLQSNVFLLAHFREVITRMKREYKVDRRHLEVIGAIKYVYDVGKIGTIKRLSEILPTMSPQDLRDTLKVLVYLGIAETRNPGNGSRVWTLKRVYFLFDTLDRIYDQIET